MQRKKEETALLSLTTSLAERWSRGMLACIYRWNLMLTCKGSTVYTESVIHLVYPRVNTLRVERDTLSGGATFLASHIQAFT